MELLYVLAGGALVIAGFLIGKAEKRPAKEPDMQIHHEPATPHAEIVAEPEPIEEDPNKIPVETQLADMQSYDPMSVRKKGRTEA